MAALAGDCIAVRSNSSEPIFLRGPGYLLQEDIARGDCIMERV